MRKGLWSVLAGVIGVALASRYLGVFEAEGFDSFDSWRGSLLLCRQFQSSVN